MMVRAVNDNRKRIVFIQTKWRLHHDNMNQRISILQDEIWPQQVNFLAYRYLKYKRHLLVCRDQYDQMITQKVMHNIQYINGYVEKRVIELYMARCNMLHTVRFLVWSAIHRRYNYETKQVSTFERETNDVLAFR